MTQKFIQDKTQISILKQQLYTLKQSYLKTIKYSVCVCVYIYTGEKNRYNNFIVSYYRK